MTRDLPGGLSAKFQETFQSRRAPEIDVNKNSGNYNNNRFNMPNHNNETKVPCDLQALSFSNSCPFCLSILDFSYRIFS